MIWSSSAVILYQLPVVPIKAAQCVRHHLGLQGEKQYSLNIGWSCCFCNGLLLLRPFGAKFDIQWLVRAFWTPTFALFHWHTDTVQLRLLKCCNDWFVNWLQWFNVFLIKIISCGRGQRHYHFDWFLWYMTLRFHGDRWWQPFCKQCDCGECIECILKYVTSVGGLAKRRIVPTNFFGGIVTA